MIWRIRLTLMVSSGPKSVGDIDGRLPRRGAYGEYLAALSEGMDCDLDGLVGDNGGEMAFSVVSRPKVAISSTKEGRVAILDLNLPLQKLGGYIRDENVP
jgi:hypothetical protein